jgi:hypothetical protein
VTLGLLHGGELLDGLDDDVDSLLELLLGDHQGWREANDIAVSGLGLFMQRQYVFSEQK